MSHLAHADIRLGSVLYCCWT